MKLATKILTGIYLLVTVFSFLEILRGDIMDGVVGFIIAFSIYKFTKFMSWKPILTKEGGVN